MVKIMENPIKMDDLGENPLFLETPISSLVLLVVFTHTICFHVLKGQLKRFSCNLDLLGRDFLCRSPEAGNEGIYASSCHNHV